MLINVDHLKFVSRDLTVFYDK